MAGIVIRTRQAVSLNCFSAILKNKAIPRKAGITDERYDDF